MDVRDWIQVFISLFVLVNPLEGIPFLLAKTAGVELAVRDEVARRAAIAVTIILLASAVIGAKVLALFGIGLPAFQAGGGIILFLIALQMTLFGVSDEGPAADSTPHHGPPTDIAIIPLAIPLLAGPGAISAAVLYGTKSQSLVHLVILCAVVLIVGAAVYVSLRLAQQLRGMLGDLGIDIATRLMGLLIAAIAAQLTVEGLLALVANLKTTA
jgi:multiple antibiotic resistance protein